MRRDFARLLSYLIGWGAIYVQHLFVSLQMCISSDGFGKVNIITEAGDPDKASSMFDPFAFEEGCTLVEVLADYRRWVVLGYTTEGGYQLANAEGEIHKFSKWDAELLFCRALPSSHTRRHSDL